MTDIAAEIAALDRMTTGDLAERYAELHGQPCRTRKPPARNDDLACGSRALCDFARLAVRPGVL